MTAVEPSALTPSLSPVEEEHNGEKIEKENKKVWRIGTHTPYKVQASSLSVCSIRTTSERQASLQGPFRFDHAMPKVSCVAEHGTEALGGPERPLGLPAKQAQVLSPFSRSSPNKLRSLQQPNTDYNVTGNHEMLSTGDKTSPYLIISLGL